MTHYTAHRLALHRKLSAVRQELAELERNLHELDLQEQQARTPKDLPMMLDEYRRYGRQMILPGFGLPGQLKLRQARVLVVGAGGLGCPAMMYLAGAGVGHITIADNDTVEASNLHRQVLHAQSRVGLSKAESAKIGMNSINPLVHVQAVNARFDEEQLDPAISQVGSLSDFSLVMDCTDNARTRYLLSDACVDADVTLVSGGAVGLEGWSGIWNLPGAQSHPQDCSDGSTDARGPCLRCIYPQSAQDNSGNCEDDGILGTVVGVIGTLMATDAIKLLVGLHDLRPSMTLFSPLSVPMFRNIKLRQRKAGCTGCGTSEDRDRRPPAATAFCGIAEVEGDERVTSRDLEKMLREQSKSSVIVDVRPEVEYGICSIPGSINLPHSTLARNPSTLKEVTLDKSEIIVLCRRGNDSLVDARKMREMLGDAAEAKVMDLRGGLTAWHAHDPSFPLY